MPHDRPTPPQTAAGWQPELDELAAREALARRWAGRNGSRASTPAAGSRCASGSTACSTPAASTRWARSPARRPTTPDQRASHRFMPGQLRVRPRHGRRPPGGGRRRRLHPARRLGGCLDQGQADACRSRWRRSFRMPIIRLIEGSGGGGSVKTIETTGRANLPGGLPRPTSFDSASPRTWAPVPVVALGLGSVAGLGAARLAASHYSVMVKDISAVFVAGPPVVERLGEPRTKQELGGWEIQTGCGAVDHAVDTEEEAFAAARRFLSYLPGSVLRPAAAGARAGTIRRGATDFLIVGDPARHASRPTTCAGSSRRVVDADSFFEMGSRFGRSIITGLARLDGWPVALLAGDPLYHGGAWTADACQKIIRFVDLARDVPPADRAPGGLPGLPGRAGGGTSGGDPLGRARARGDQPDHGALVQRDRAQRVTASAGSATSRSAICALRYAWPSASWGSLPLEGGDRGGVPRGDRRRGGPGGQARRDRGAAERAALAVPHRRGRSGWRRSSTRATRAGC